MTRALTPPPRDRIAIVLTSRDRIAIVLTPRKHACSPRLRPAPIVIVSVDQA